MAEFDDIDNDDDLDWKPKRSNFAAFVLPIVTALIALGVGGLLGAIITKVVTPDPIPVEVARDLTPEELEAVCESLVANALTKLNDAEEKVKSLSTKVTDKEALVLALETEMKKRGDRGKKMYRELKAAKAELLTLREELAVAVEEKEQLVIELKETVEKLEETEETLQVTKGKLEVAKEDVLKNRWIGFVQDAMLQVCEKGNRKKMGKCRETITAALTPTMRDKFRHCVKAGQSIPTVLEAEKKQRNLPLYAEWLGEGNRVTKGWYVLFCDPTLPEADDLTEVLRNIDKRGTDNFQLDDIDDFDFDEEKMEEDNAPITTPKPKGDFDDLDDLDDFELDLD
jgi:predicted  nucleic acid-binding Zn-ribbon protein